MEEEVLIRLARHLIEVDGAAGVRFEHGQPFGDVVKIVPIYDDDEAAEIEVDADIDDEHDNT